MITVVFLADADYFLGGPFGIDPACEPGIPLAGRTSGNCGTCPVRAGAGFSLIHALPGAGGGGASAGTPSLPPIGSFGTG